MKTIKILIAIIMVMAMLGAWLIKLNEWHKDQIEEAIFAGWYIGATDIGNYVIAKKSKFYHKRLNPDEILLSAKKIMEVGYERRNESGVSLYN